MIPVATLAEAPAPAPAVAIHQVIDATQTIAGRPLRLPSKVQVRITETSLSPGGVLRRPPGLVARYAEIRAGQIQVTAPGQRPARRTDGEWIVDDGDSEWQAMPEAEHSPGGTARLLLIEQFATEGAARAAGGTPGAASTDYAGTPIHMPPGPLRVMVSRYRIGGHAELPWHHHTWPRYGYVSHGGIRVENRDGTHHTFGAGDTIVERRDHVHRGVNPADGPVELVVVDVVPEAIKSNTVLSHEDHGMPPSKP